MIGDGDTIHRHISQRVTIVNKRRCETLPILHISYPIVIANQITPCSWEELYKVKRSKSDVSSYKLSLIFETRQCGRSQYYQTSHQSSVNSCFQPNPIHCFFQSPCTQHSSTSSLSFSLRIIRGRLFILRQRVHRSPCVKFDIVTSGLAHEIDPFFQMCLIMSSVFYIPILWGCINRRVSNDAKQGVHVIDSGDNHNVSKDDSDEYFICAFRKILYSLMLRWVWRSEICWMFRMVKYSWGDCETRRMIEDVNEYLGVGRRTACNVVV